MLDTYEVVRRIKEIEDALQLLREDLLSDDDNIEVVGQGTWRRSMLAELHPYLEGSPGVLALFDEAANHPDEQISYVAVRSRSGLSDMGQRNAHAGLSRSVVRLFGRKTWPLAAWQDPNDGIMRYRMPGVVAVWWTDLRSDRS
jgi:hypothetical protein